MEISLPEVTERRNGGADAPPETTPILTAISCRRTNDNDAQKRTDTSGA
jgi:hypothetical protein